MATKAQKTTTRLLEDIGLTKNEAKVYVALLELGRGTVAQVAQRAGINRTTGYSLLSNLAHRGFASITGHEPKQEFLAESPERLVSYFKKQASTAREQAQAAEELLPQLSTIHNVDDRPKVLFYEGEEGLKQVYEDTLTSTETIRAYATIDDMHKALPGYFPKYYQRRARLGIHARGILLDTIEGRERIKHDHEENRETALIPSDKFYFSPEINIYDNKVMIASWREKLGIIIESAEIADALKKIYELSWAEAKRLDAKARTTV